MAERDTPFDEVRRHAVGEYAAQHTALQAAGAAYVHDVVGVLDDAGINYLSVTGRTKTVQSFAAKAMRTAADGSPLYADPLRQITDAIGVRVITYVSRDVDAVAELLGEEMVVLDDRDLGQATAQEGRFGYASRHLLVRRRDTGAPASGDQVARHASVQVRTVLQHAWAEFEHDIRYKGTVPADYAPDFDRRFTLAAGLLELADREFSQIRDRLQQHAGSTPLTPADGGPRIATHDLALIRAAKPHVQARVLRISSRRLQLAGADL